MYYISGSNSYYFILFRFSRDNITLAELFGIPPEQNDDFYELISMSLSCDKVYSIRQSF